MWQINFKIIGLIYMLMVLISILSMNQAYKESNFILMTICAIFVLIFAVVVVFGFKGNLWVRYFVLPISGIEAVVLILSLLLCLVWGNAGVYGTAYFYVFHPEFWLYAVFPNYLLERFKIQNTLMVYCPLFLSMLVAHLFCFIASIKKP